MGSPSGTFAPFSSTYAVTGPCQGMQVSDLNNDGRSDVISANSSGLDIYLGTASNSLAAVTLFSVTVGLVGSL